MRSTITGVFLLMVACGLAAAQTGKSDNDQAPLILALESGWNQAEVTHDARALNMLIAENFAYTDSDGTFMDKQQWLAHVSKGTDEYEDLGNSAMKVHVFGTAAVVTGIYHEKIKVHGKMVARSGRFTDTWVQEQRVWKCVASQATLLSR